MRIEPGDIADLSPAIRTVVRAVLEDVQEEQAKLNGRLAYGEREAASLLGVQWYSLRDARLRGEIVATRIGRKVIYSRESLVAFLATGNDR